MRSKLKMIFRGKLNKSGFALAEVFLAFFCLISLSIIITNSISPKTDTITQVSYAEEDYLESLKAITRSIYNTSDIVSLNTILSNHIQSVNVSDPSTLYLTNNLVENDSGFSLTDSGQTTEIISRTVLGDVSISLSLDELLNTGAINITLESYKNSQFTAKPVNNLELIDRESLPSMTSGNYWSLPRQFITNNLDTEEFSTLLIPNDGTETEVLRYEKVY